MYCSFCGKSQEEVGLLIAGPAVFICDECVEVCIGILNEAIDQRKTPTPNASHERPALGD